MNFEQHFSEKQKGIDIHSQFSHYGGFYYLK